MKKYYRVKFTLDIGIKRERIKEFEEFVKCESEKDIAPILEGLYGENGTRKTGKNLTVKSVEEI